MTIETTTGPVGRKPELLGQTVVLIGGGAGIGLETARMADRRGSAPHRRRRPRAVEVVELLAVKTLDAPDAYAAAGVPMRTSKMAGAAVQSRAA